MIILGDFNFHLDAVTDPAAAQFLNLLDTFNLVQHVNAPTHKSGHTLDLVITRAGENLVKDFKVSDPMISDHLAIHCGLSLKKPDFERKEVTCRKLRSVNIDSFIQDIKNSKLMAHLDFDNASDLTDHYDHVLSTLLDQHAPIKKRVVTLRPAAPWYTDEIRSEKAKRRKLERRWRKNKLTVNREMYVKQCNLVNNLISESKTKFYTTVIEENSTNPKVLFSAVNKLLNLKATKKLPSYDNALDLANDFVDYFFNKIQTIKAGLISQNTSYQDTHCCPDVELHEFTPTTAEELSSLI